MALQKAQGKIEQIFIKALPTPDKYENTHRASIKLDDGEWYQMGSLKKPSFDVQDDDGKWKALGEGSEVLIKYEQNGDWRNSNRSKMTVLEFVEGGSTPKTSSASTSFSGSSSGGTDWARKDAGAAASASIDKAIALLSTGNFGDWGEGDILPLARRMQEMVKNLAYDILHENQSEGKAPAKKAAAKSKPKPEPKVSDSEADDEWDDDIPF